MSSEPSAGLVVCPHCGLATPQLIAADGSFRCRYCARPIGKVAEPSDIGFPYTEVQEPPSDPTGGLVLVIMVISILFVPLFIDVFLLPAVGCWYWNYSRDRTDRRGGSSSETGTLQ